VEIFWPNVQLVLGFIRLGLIGSVELGFGLRWLSGTSQVHGMLNVWPKNVTEGDTATRKLRIVRLTYLNWPDFVWIECPMIGRSYGELGSARSDPVLRTGKPTRAMSPCVECARMCDGMINWASVHVQKAGVNVAYTAVAHVSDVRRLYHRELAAWVKAGMSCHLCRVAVNTVWSQMARGCEAAIPGYFMHDACMCTETRQWRFQHSNSGGGAFWATVKVGAKTRGIDEAVFAILR